MTMSNDLGNDLLAFLFNNTAWPGAYGADLYISLHTADPGAAGNQTTSECAYTSYARVAVPRGADWTVVVNAATNANDITFPACTGGTETATYFGVGLDAAGAGQLLYSGALTNPLPISNGIQPNIPPGDITISQVNCP